MGKPLRFEKDYILQMATAEMVDLSAMDLAREMAVLGAIDAARELASLFHCAPPVAGHEIVDSLAWAWKLTGTWPAGMPVELQRDANFAELREDYENYWPKCLPDDIPREYTKSVLDELISQRNDPRSPRAVDSSSGSAAIEETNRLVKALDISLRLAKPSMQTQKIGDVDKMSMDEHSAQLFARVAARWGANGQTRALTRAEHLWPYFGAGVVADAISLTVDDRRERCAEIIETFRRRFAQGTLPNPLKKKSLQEIASLADHNTRTLDSARLFWAACGDIDYENPADTVPSLFQTSATNVDLAKLESRLKIALPSDYKDFLRISNGFKTLTNWGIFTGISPDPPIHASDDVTWEHNCIFPDWCELLQLPNDIEELVTAHEHADFRSSPLPRFMNVIKIGGTIDDQLWLVPPTLVAEARSVYLDMWAKADELQRKKMHRVIENMAGSLEAFKNIEWCCVQSGAGGAPFITAYPSFRAYLESATLMSILDIEN